MSEEQLLVFKSLEDELNDGNYHLLAKPADEFELLFGRPEDRSLNPLVIRSILHFYLYCGSTDYTGPHGLRPLDMKIILACKTLSQLFSLGIKHFRDCLFTKPPAIQGTPEKPASRTASQSAELGKQKFDQLLSYIYVSRKGITWQELRELIPNLTDEDIDIF